MYDKMKQTVYPEMVVKDFQKAVDWYDKVFGAKVEEVHRENGSEDGRVMHSLVRLANGAGLFLVDDFEKTADASAEDGMNTAVTLHAQVKDVEAFWKRMEAAGGAMVTMDLKVQFWGHKYGRFVDPFGHKWSVGDIDEESGQTEEEANGQHQDKKHKTDAVAEDKDEP